MTDGPQEPEELVGIRTVTILTSDADTWAIDLEYPEWMTPYEAYGMILAAKRKIKAELKDLNDEEEEERDD